MTEDRKPTSEQEVQELRGNLYKLAHLPIVQKQLGAGNGTWLVRPAGLPMDVAFLQKGTGTNLEDISFLGLNLCSKDNVIGIQIRQGKSGVSSGLRKLENDTNVTELTNRGARVIVMTSRELKGWVGFYDQVDREGLESGLGERVLSMSGLEWLTEKESKEMYKGLEEAIDENWNYIGSFGVKEMGSFGDADLAFLDDSGKPTAVPIFHASEWSMNGDILVEKVSDKPVLCGGMVVKRVGESDRSLMARALAAEARLNEEIGLPVEVLKVNQGQVNLWRKMGFSESWKAIENRSELTAEEVVRFLYLGNDSLHPGELAKPPLGLSLPGRGGALSFSGVDIVFTNREANGKRVVKGVDNFLVWDKKGSETSLSNVAGIRIFPRGTSFDEMKMFTDPIRNDLAHRTGIPGAYILNLTPELFERWKSGGSPFSSAETAAKEVSLKKRHEYFMPGTAEKVFYFQLRQKAEIGGNKNGLVLVDGGGNTVTHLFDVGLGFKDMPRGFNGIGKDPNTADGLLRLLRTGVLPMVPGWWETEYLKQTALKMTGLAYPSHVRSDVVAKYVVSELVSRCTEEELRRLLPSDVVNNILRLGPGIRENWWGKGERLVETATPTHPHADHISLFSYLSSDIRVILSGPEVGFFNALTQKAGTWRRRLTDRKLITEPMIGKSYQVEQMDIDPYYFSGNQVRLSSQVTMEPYFVTHSVPGVWQLYTARTRNGGMIKIFNSGDWNVDRERKVFEVAEKISGKPDVIVMEATNVGSEKAYLGKTESDVRDTMMNLVRNSERDLVVAVAPINNLTRLKGLLEVAEATGRKLALSFPHAELALQLAAAKKLAPAGAEGFDDVLPYDLGNDKVTIWAKQMTSPRTFHKSLIEIANRGNLGVLNHERLSAENGKWIVVVSPFDVLEDQFDGLRIASNMKVVWMASYPYDQEQRYFIGANNDWMRRSGKVKFIADMEVGGQGGRVTSKLYGDGVLHVSGHATPEEMVAITEILVGKDRKNIPVIVNHSEAPEEAARLLISRLGDKVRPISRLDRYDPGDPQKHPGFYLPLI